MAIIDDLHPPHHAGVHHIVSWERPNPRAMLRGRLVLTDLSALMVSWALAYNLGGGSDSPKASVAALLAAIVVVTLALIRRQRLYQSRVATVRSEEVARIGQVACAAAVMAAGTAEVTGVELGGAMIASGALATFVLLAYGRGRFQAWLGDQRSNGHYARPVVLVGASDEIAPLVDLFADSPELGITPVGFAGPLDLDGPVPSIPWLGGPGEVLPAVHSCAASGVVICAASMPSASMNRLVRDLHGAGIHVHLWSGITGMHHRRLRVQPIGHEPLIYVERVTLSRTQLVAKRVVDVIGALMALVVFAPVLAVAAVAIKLVDGGPVIFKQVRVGRGGRPFTILKLRTMCVDAEERFEELRARNERDGPCFKLEDDPRVTRVGRFLRASSIDELPQLVNVLEGTMSLVGPRPALPREVASFDARLIDRHNVAPGMTGLWQVEARDKSSFEIYRRLDVFYVENWSIWLDGAILLKTARAVVRRLTRSAASTQPSVIIHVPDVVPASGLAE